MLSAAPLRRYRESDVSLSGTLRVLVVAQEPDARKAIRESLDALSGVEVVDDVADVRQATLRAARLHPNLVFAAIAADDEEAGVQLPGLLRVAPGARVVFSLLEEWTGPRGPEAGPFDLGEVYQVLREARAADDRGPASKRKEGTLSMLAHDILTPATAVIGVADLLLRYWERFDETQRREAVANISDVARDLASLVRGVVRAAAADAGSLVGEREPVDVNELLEEAVGGILHIAPEHVLELEAPPGLPTVWADRLRILEAVLNYLSNAVKYAPAGTTVRLVADADEREVRVEVADQGGGIAEEDRSKLFRKFSRLHKDEVRGHGLGLYLVKAIVEAHGGRVWVGGVPGEGAVFGLALPATGRTRGRGSRRSRRG